MRRRFRPDVDRAAEGLRFSMAGRIAGRAREGVDHVAGVRRAREGAGRPVSVRLDRAVAGKSSRFGDDGSTMRVRRAQIHEHLQEAGLIILIPDYPLYQVLEDFQASLEKDPDIPDP